MAEEPGSGGVSRESMDVLGSRFHLVWLRDNCLCSACQDPGTWQKLYDITTTPLAPRIRSHAIDDSALRIVWDEDPPHESRYPLPWLRQRAYDPPPPAEIRRPRLWRASDWAGRPPSGRAASDPRWRDEVLEHGFSLITGLDQAGYEALLDDTGPRQHTEFGPVAPLRARPDANDLGETGAPLDPHTDYTVYMCFPPVVSFLHCVRNDSDGGTSVLVDGFAVAERLREADPAAFDLLARTPLPFHQLYPRWRFHHLRLRPMIELDASGEVRGVHAGQPHTRDWSLPFDEMVPVYEAYAKLTRWLRDPAFQIRHRLLPGECLAYQNERVLHGRTGFSPEVGERHLQIAYVGWSYFTARRHFERGEASLGAFAGLAARCSAGVLPRELPGEVVLLHLDSGVYYGLSGVGYRMWRSLLQADGVEAALRDLRGAFDPPPASLAHDLGALLRELDRRGLIDLLPAPQPAAAPAIAAAPAPGPYEAPELVVHGRTRDLAHETPTRSGTLDPDDQPAPGSPAAS
jgi:alpha-ketoglutarate-dependent taurine dioxygenase